MQAAPPPVKKPSLRTAEPHRDERIRRQGSDLFFSFAWWSNRVRRSSAFLSSALVHALMLLALAWFVYVDPHGGRHHSSSVRILRCKRNSINSSSRTSLPRNPHLPTIPKPRQSGLFAEQDAGTEETNATSQSVPALSIVTETAPPTLVRLDPFSAGQLAMLPVAPRLRKAR